MAEFASSSQLAPVLEAIDCVEPMADNMPAKGDTVWLGASAEDAAVEDWPVDDEEFAEVDEVACDELVRFAHGVVKTEETDIARNRFAPSSRPDSYCRLMRLKKA